jgi:hypothetical protein
MRVKTNLTSAELVLVSKGLNSLATTEQKDGKFVPSNKAESSLLASAGSALDEMLDNLTTEVKELFNE